MIKTLAAALALGLAGGLSWLLAAGQGLRVVKIEGELAAAEAEDVRRQIAGALNGGFFTLNAAHLRDQVLELAWPGEVSIRKVWPDTVVVRVARKTIAARWGDGSYLNPAGEIVKALAGSRDVPVFECRLASAQEAMEVYRYLQEMAAVEGLEIRRMEENEIGEWRLSFAEGPMLMLGADRLSERMGRFLAAYPRLLARAGNEIEQVDLRYGNGLSVRWRQPAPPPEPDFEAGPWTAAR